VCDGSFDDAVRGTGAPRSNLALLRPLVSEQDSARAAAVQHNAFSLSLNLALWGLAMTDPTTNRPDRNRRAMRGTLRQNAAPAAHVVIGFAHVASGALGIFGALSQGVFSANGVAPLPMIAIAIGGIASGLLVLGGLWLADGRRRGALLALSMDGLRVLALLAVGAIGSVSLIASLVLGAAAVWVWPQLEVPTSARGG
jgi:hypothetical protein